MLNVSHKFYRVLQVVEHGNRGNDIQFISLKEMGQLIGRKKILHNRRMFYFQGNITRVTTILFIAVRIESQQRSIITPYIKDAQVGSAEKRHNCLSDSFKV